MYGFFFFFFLEPLLRARLILLGYLGAQGYREGGFVDDRDKMFPT